jgi:hypothetical protein
MSISSIGPSSSISSYFNESDNIASKPTLYKDTEFEAIDRFSMYIQGNRNSFSTEEEETFDSFLENENLLLDRKTWNLSSHVDKSTRFIAYEKIIRMLVAKHNFSLAEFFTIPLENFADNYFTNNSSDSDQDDEDDSIENNVLDASSAQEIISKLHNLISDERRLQNNNLALSIINATNKGSAFSVSSFPSCSFSCDVTSSQDFSLQILQLTPLTSSNVSTNVTSSQAQNTTSQTEQPTPQSSSSASTNATSSQAQNTSSNDPRRFRSYEEKIKTLMRMR